MADWKQLLKQVILADDVVDAAEVGLLETEILADNIVDSDEIEFLIDLRNSAKSVCQEFNAFFFRALKLHILADRVITADETALIKRVLLADGVIDDNEKAFLRELKKDAASTAAEFDAFCEESLR